MSSKIADANDRFRVDLGFGHKGKVVLTLGVRMLADEDRSALLRKIQTLTVFDPGNDPYGEHDFGVVDHNDERWFFKIDYFTDMTFRMGADPNNKEVVRVMTIMRCDEY